MPSRAMTANDKRWRAEEDAHSLARAEEIKNDSARMKAAAEAATRMAKEEEERARAMRKVAGGKGSDTEKKKESPKKKKSGRKMRTLKKPAKRPDSYNTFKRI